MEDIALEPESPQPEPQTKEEKLYKQWGQKQKEIKIGLAKCHVLRSQITQAYAILDKVRFDFLGDTAFREKIVRAKKELENALSDFLLDEQYHRTKLEEHRETSTEGYDKQLRELAKGDASTQQSK